MRSVYFLIIYFPLHEVILRYLSLPDAAYFFVRQWPEIFLLLLFASLLMRQKPSQLVARPIHNPLPWIALFLLQSLALVFLTDGNDKVIGLGELYSLTRYILLFFIILLIQPSHNQIKFAVRLLLISALLQLFVGFLQIGLGENFIEYFKPVDYYSYVEQSERSFTSNRDNQRSYLIGTAGDFISFAYILSFGILILQCEKKSAKTTFALIALYSILFLSGSRTIFLGTLFTHAVLAIWLSAGGRKIFYSYFLTSAAALSFVFLSYISQNSTYSYTGYASLFNPRFFEALMNQRLGVIVYIIPEYILSGDFLTGLSPDRYHLVNHISAEYPFIPKILLATLTGTVEDIYLVCLWLYYGTFGYFCLYQIYWNLLKATKYLRANSASNLGVIGLGCLIYFIFFNLGNQAAENRIFSFNFWLLVGLMTVSLRQTYSALQKVQAPLGSAMLSVNSRR